MKFQYTHKLLNFFFRKFENIDCFPYFGSIGKPVEQSRFGIVDRFNCRCSPSKLRGKVDQFFDHVEVYCGDGRLDQVIAWKMLWTEENDFYDQFIGSNLKQDTLVFSLYC